MRYDLRLRIGYRYAFPVKEARHALRICPRTDRGQSVERLALELRPTPAELAADTDFFGNATRHLRLEGAHGEFAVEMRARARVSRGPPPAHTPTLRQIAQAAERCREPEGGSPIHHLGPSRLVSLPRAARDFAAGAIGAPDTPALKAVLALARAIQRDFLYESGSTGIQTRVEETLRDRRGVCQDFAHLMIAALRGLGVPAAYVSGFIRTEPPPGLPRLEGADSMHAWVDVWLGEEAGWVGFDPTNGCLALDGHIIVALGRDYADVAPVDGVLITAGPQSAWHNVDVIPLENEE
ncbi:transglutaminase family protein [Aureimonas populi]|uniref:Transglutaminase domain-containing protein n=1 Tax=Aureimonas populi TaxID=1701758 RepID=A0ABW5CRA4_9HYPH|nr:transglutaminase family protein [Aureimonas populi]